MIGWLLANRNIFNFHPWQWKLYSGWPAASKWLGLCLDSLNRRHGMLEIGYRGWLTVCEWALIGRNLFDCYCGILKVGNGRCPAPDPSKGLLVSRNRLNRYYGILKIGC
jgi:hypothetical protein